MVKGAYQAPSHQAVQAMDVAYWKDMMQLMPVVFPL